MAGKMASEGYCSSRGQQYCVEGVYYTTVPRTNGLKHYLQERMKKYCLEQGLNPPTIPKVRKVIMVRPSNKDATCKNTNPSNLDMASGSKRDNTQTKMRSCSPLPPQEEVIVSEDPSGEKRKSSLPVKISQPHLNVKARSVGMDRYRSLAPQSSTSHDGPRKRKNKRKKKKATSNPSDSNENLTSSERPQQKNECGENDMQSLLDLPPSSLVSRTGPVTQAIFNGKAYQQQDSGCKDSSDNHFTTNGIAASSPLPDITLNMDIENRKLSTANEDIDHSSDIEKQIEILTISPQSKGIEPTSEDKVNDSSQSSSSEVIGMCLSGEYRKTSFPSSSSEIVDSMSVIEVPKELDKAGKQHPAGLDPTPNDKLNSSSLNTNMEEGKDTELVVYRDCGLAQNVGTETFESPTSTSFEQPIIISDNFYNKSSKNMNEVIPPCCVVDVYSGATTKPSVSTQETYTNKKITKLSLPQKRKFSQISTPSEENEETHGTSGHINQSSAKRKVQMELTPYNSSPSIPVQKEKEKSQEISIVSTFPEQSDSEVDWVGKSNADQYTPARNDPAIEVGWVGKSNADQYSPARNEPATLSTPIEGPCFSLSIDGTTDSLISQAASDIEKRASPHFLEPRSQECLKHVVGVLIQDYGCSMEECLETMSKNKYNILTTLQELQSMKPCM
ncbi:uncharacterized protein LOC143030463 [Oratosquilla oratoria]|uniref:uncharacterized protein LOC143030463 n=1 Tax=Oratosquilla oratoria TaxID=337810 RepID=UPI003F7755FC